jgi:hypothetical protein
MVPPQVEIPGMPGEAELRFAIVVPPLGKIALEPTVFVDSDSKTPSTVRADMNPNRRRAFGSTPNLIKVPVNPDIEVTSLDVAHIQPAYLGAALYARRGKKVVDGLAFNPEEHKMFIFSMGTFLQRVSDNAERKYAGSNETLREEKPLLHRRDALEVRLIKHDAALEGYRGQWQSIGTLQHHAMAPGFANSTEGELRALATEVWEGPLTNMLGVVANEKTWTPAEQQAASEALLRALLYGSQRGRVQNWRVALSMVQKYTKDRGLIVGTRRKQIDSNLSIIKKNLENIYDRTGFTPR